MTCPLFNISIWILDFILALTMRVLKFVWHLTVRHKAVLWWGPRMNRDSCAVGKNSWPRLHSRWVASQERNNRLSSTKVGEDRGDGSLRSSVIVKETTLYECLVDVSWGLCWVRFSRDDVSPFQNQHLNSRFYFGFNIASSEVSRFIFIYLSSNTSSAENEVNIRIGKA